MDTKYYSYFSITLIFLKYLKTHLIVINGKLLSVYFFLHIEKLQKKPVMFTNYIESIKKKDIHFFWGE